MREPAPLSFEPKRLSVRELWAQASAIDELLSDLEAIKEHYDKAARDAANACERFRFEAQKAERLLHDARRRSVDLCRHLDQMARDALTRAAETATQ